MGYHGGYFISHFGNGTSENVHLQKRITFLLLPDCSLADTGLDEGSDLLVCNNRYMSIQYGPAHKILVLTASPGNEGLGEPVFMHGLARAFSAHIIHKVCM